MAFCSPDEVQVALDGGKVALHARIRVRVDGKLVTTTVGRVVFNRYCPAELGFVNEVLTKRRIEEIVLQSYQRAGSHKTALFLDRLKELGFDFATEGGLSVGLEDVLVPPEKDDLIAHATQ